MDYCLFDRVTLRVIFLVTMASAHITEVRLAEGDNPHEGRVEVLYHGEWATVCDLWWGIEEANVVCNKLGYDGAVKALGGAFYGEGTVPILKGFLSCRGYEGAIDDCYIGKWNPPRCSDHSYDASAVCRLIPPVQNALRQKTHFSKLEILHDGEWGYICYDGWNDNNADVACRMLGYEKSNHHFGWRGRNSRRRWMKDVLCTGKEENIEECAHDGWGDYSCSRVVWVGCLGTYQGNSCGGRVCGDSMPFCCPGIDDQYHYCCDNASQYTTDGGYSISTTNNLAEYQTSAVTTEPSSPKDSQRDRLTAQPTDAFEHETRSQTTTTTTATNTTTAFATTKTLGFGMNTTVKLHQTEISKSLWWISMILICSAVVITLIIIVYRSCGSKISSNFLRSHHAEQEAPYLASNQHNLRSSVNPVFDGNLEAMFTLPPSFDSRPTKARKLASEYDPPPDYNSLNFGGNHAESADAIYRIS